LKEGECCPEAEEGGLAQTEGRPERGVRRERGLTKQGGKKEEFIRCAKKENAKLDW